MYEKATYQEFRQFFGNCRVLSTSTTWQLIDSKPTVSGVSLETMKTFVEVFGILYFAVALYQFLTGNKWPPKPVWYAANILAVLLTPWQGYVSIAPERLRHTNPDAVFCALILLTMPLFSIGCVYFSIHARNHKKLPRPTWNRNPLNWWDDPLQSLFISTWLASGGAVGSAFRNPGVGTVAFWTVGMNVCVALGLGIEQVLIYRIYREHISAAIS